MECGKDTTCEHAERKGLDQETIDKIKDDMFVDDGCTGSDEEGAKKLIGNMKVTSNGKLEYDGTFSQVLKLGGFKSKVFIRSGPNPPEALDLLGKVLGHDWLHS